MIKDLINQENSFQNKKSSENSSSFKQTNENLKLSQKSNENEHLKKFDNYGEQKQQLQKQVSNNYNSASSTIDLSNLNKAVSKDQYKPQKADKKSVESNKDQKQFENQENFNSTQVSNLSTLQIANQKNEQPQLANIHQDNQNNQKNQNSEQIKQDADKSNLSDVLTIRSNSPGEKAFKNIKNQFSNFDIRRVYKFIKPLGGGNFGTVRLAHRISDPQIKYAVKSILRQNIKNDVQSLEEELEILRNVDHPNIIKFHESYIDYRYIHIVMELAYGGELFEKIVQSKRFSEKRAAHYMRKILSAVKHLHEQMICHRDLKPENFLLADNSQDAEIKLIDFGLSKRFGVKNVESQKTNQINLKTVVGTPYYVAPEVLRQSYDKSCDIWSLGIILYIFLCGYPPFEGDDSKEIFRNILSQELKFEREDWQNISQEAKNLIRRMLDKNPKTRFTAQQCIEHPWFKIQQFDTPISVKESVVNKLKNFRALKQIQLETLKFLVNNVITDIDFKSLREAFRAIDTSNSGKITIEQVKKGFRHDNNITYINENQIHELFEKFGSSTSGEINYSEFLAATVDRQRALTKENLRFAFHYFDTDNEGYITKDDLKEVFRRQGTSISDEFLNKIISQAKNNIDEKQESSEQQAEIVENHNGETEINLQKSDQFKKEEYKEEEKSRLQSPLRRNVNIDDCISFEEFEKIMKQIV